MFIRDYRFSVPVSPIQGRRKKSLNVLMAESGHERFIRPIEINPARHRQISEELNVAGISQATLFPDLDGLAGDLSRQLSQKKAT